MTAVGSYGLNPERKLVDYVIDEVDGVFLIASLIDFQSADAGRIINGCVLIATHRVPRFCLEYHEVNVNLDVMARDLFVVAFGMNCLASFTVPP